MGAHTAPLGGAVGILPFFVLLSSKRGLNLHLETELGRLVFVIASQEVTKARAKWERIFFKWPFIRRYRALFYFQGDIHAQNPKNTKSGTHFDEKGLLRKSASIWLCSQSPPSRPHRAARLVCRFA